MNTLSVKSSVAAAAVAGGMLVVSTAHAHINMLAPLLGRAGDEKTAPCEGKARGTVYTFEPGATISLGVTEAVAHPSYFRIAFDNDGEDAFKDPASIVPIYRPCLTDKPDNCKASDFCNVMSSTGGASVLYDKVDPHFGKITDFFAPRKQFTWEVTLPNVECANCTLQILQIMEDAAEHGGYCPKGQCTGESPYIEDIYHRCVDIVLKKGVGMTPGTIATPSQKPNGIDCVAMAKGEDAGMPVIEPIPADAGQVSDGGVVPPNPSTDSGAPVNNPGNLIDGGVAGTTPDAGTATAPEEDSGCSVSGVGRARESGMALLLGLAAGALVVRRRRGK